MTTTNHDEMLNHSIGLILRSQVLLAAALVVGAALWSHPSSALAALFGSALGIVGTLVSARSVKRTSRHAGAGPVYSLVPVYMGEVQKLLIIGVGVALGLVVLDLPAMFLLCGLILAQFGYVVAAVLSSLAGDR